MRTPNNEAVALSSRHAGLVTASRISVGTDHWQAEIACQIAPSRVRLFDQVELVGAWPSLDALLAGDCGSHGIGGIEPDEARDTVAFGKAAERTFSMLDDAADQVRCHADVQRAVPTARQDVDAGLPFSHLGQSAWSWMPGQARHDGGVHG